MPERKKRILFQSDLALANTGFGRNSKCVLSHLYNTDKYEIHHYCCGVAQNNPALSRTPWKAIGTLPGAEHQIKELEKDPQAIRMASYGSLFLDPVIKEVKPDIYIAVQDIWGIDFSTSRPWFNKINTALWTTLDSLPILPSAINAAKKAENFWVWSKFAEKNMHEQGLTNVKTMHGALDVSFFYKKTKEEKLFLRSKFKMTENDFIIGFVFRNQLRKSVPNLLEGFSMWKKSCPEAKNAKLLLHTHFGEGWNIQRIGKEYGVDPQDILTTYVCQNCREYEVSPFTKQNLDCRYCGSKNSVSTTNVSVGVTEEQLNEVYNLMDVYCHPFTSGGQEIPIQEAKLAELLTLVTNYSCGEEMCEEGAYSLPLEWTEYREHGTEFRKASTCPKSIAEQLQYVFEMSASEREEAGKRARQWVVDNFSGEVIGKKLEEFIDGCDFVDYDFDFENIEKDPNAKMPHIANDSEWISVLYKKILKRENIMDDDEGHQYWMQELQKGAKRKEVEEYFRSVAIKENSQMKSQVKLSDVLDEEDKGKRILFISPQDKRDCFICTSLFKSIKEKYSDYNIYLCSQPENAQFYIGNPHIHKRIPFSKEMEDYGWIEGLISSTDFFDIVYSPQCIKENKLPIFTRQGVAKIAYSNP